MKDVRHLVGGEIIVVDGEPHYVWGKSRLMKPEDGCFKDCWTEVEVEELGGGRYYKKFPVQMVGGGFVPTEVEYIGREQPVVFRARKKFGYDTVYTRWQERDCDHVVTVRHREFPNPDSLAEELEHFAQLAEGPWSVSLVDEEDYDPHLYECEDRVLEAHENGHPWRVR